MDGGNGRLLSEVLLVEVSVVVPARDAADTICEQLEALTRQDWSGDWEVIVADNGSTDDTRSLAGAFAERLPSLRIIDASARRGAAHARNVGARDAHGRSVVFCDADDVVSDGWLSCIAAALRDSSFVASRFDFRSLNPEWLSATRGDPQSDGLQVLNYPPYLQHSGGSGLGIRRNLFREIGGFDESLRYGQDTDLCVRVQLAGTALTFAHGALVHVRIPLSSGRQLRQAFHWARHNADMYRRYRPKQHRLHRPWRNYSVEVWRLLKKFRWLRFRDRRAAWLFRAGWNLGLLTAALEHRSPPMVYSALLATRSGPTPAVAKSGIGSRGGS